MATALSGLFGRIAGLRARAYDRGWLAVSRLEAPVVSVGNLSTGGTGKTPAVIALGLALQQQGIRVAVLSRGYGRENPRQLAITERGDEDARTVGDEPKLIAQRLGAPVVLHRDRFRAGLEAGRRFHPNIYILDDGFQHRALARDFDLVLVSERDLGDRLLPAGRMREPLAALRRAQAVLWTGAGAAPDLALHTAAPVYTGRKRVVGGSGGRGGAKFAFCGLARPESFWRSLAEAGVEVVGRRAFRDHHVYTPADLRRLAAAARAAGADGLITTAKDAVKLPDRDAGEGPGVEVLEIEMDIAGMGELIGLVRATCRM